MPAELTPEILKPLKLASTLNPLSSVQKMTVIHELQKSVRRKNLLPGSDAARSQDFLYGEDGLPGDCD